MKGIFITFEGCEGSGKSTQSKLLYNYLKRKGYIVVYLREPGGTKIGERIRGVLLDTKNHITALSETLLYMAARAQVIEDIIKPALRQRKIVICDRFLDSTLAYQGFGLGMDINFIKYIGNFVTQGIKPDLTLFLDLPIKIGLKACGSTLDRIEKRSFDYHQRVKRGYHKLAKLEPKRIKIVKVDKAKFKTQEKIRKLVDDVIQRYKRSR